MNFNPLEGASYLEQDKNYVHPAVRNAHHTAEKMLREDAVDPHDFVQLYGEENVTRDLAYAEKREQEFTHDANKKYAEVLEAILYDQIELSDWFGPKARTIKTSFFDDIVNGSDLILELEELDQTLSHLSLSIDVTFGTTTEDKKFSAIKEKIDAGKLGEVKYFQSEKTGKPEKLNKVPQVVIGVEKDSVIQLAGLWMGEHGRSKEGKTKLAIHPVQRLILEEILLQLKTFKHYAEITKKDSLALIYQKNIAVLEDIIRKKPPIDMGEFRNDKVFSAIKNSLSIFKINK